MRVALVRIFKPALPEQPPWPHLQSPRPGSDGPTGVGYAQEEAGPNGKIQGGKIQGERIQRGRIQHRVEPVMELAHAEAARKAYLPVGTDVAPQLRKELWADGPVKPNGYSRSSYID